MRILSMLLIALSMTVAGSVMAEPTGVPAVAPVAPEATPAPVVTPAPAITEAAPASAPVAAPEGDKASAPAPAKAAADPKDPRIPSPKVPETDAEAGEIIGMLLDAATNGHWTVFAGLLILLLVWVFNRFGLAAKIGRKYIPWVTLGIATLVAVAVALASGGDLLNAIKLGILEGGLAIALWELLFKRLTSKKTDGTPRVPPEPEPEPEPEPA